MVPTHSEQFHSSSCTPLTHKFIPDVPVCDNEFDIIIITTSFISCDSDIRRTIHTVSYLYSPSSDIPSAVSQMDTALHFNLQTSDHIKFLMDISLQLTDHDIVSSLGQSLRLKDYQIRQIEHDFPNDVTWQVYEALCAWVAGSPLQATLCSLRGVLLNCGVYGMEMIDAQATILNHQTLYSTPTPGTDDSDFLNSIGTAIQLCWKPIGSLMGVERETLDVHAHQERQLYEQSYQMLRRWQRQNGVEATYGILFKAIQRMHEHRPHVANHARWCALRLVK